MNLAPLTNAPLPIQLHAYAAMAAFVLGVVQLAGVKGTTRHRALGYAWAASMLFVAISSFWIHDLRVWGAWSPIHLLSIFTLAMVPIRIWLELNLSPDVSLICAGGEAASTGDRGVSLLGGRRSTAARRQFLWSIGAGDIVGSGRDPARGPRFRRRSQRVL